MGRGTVSRVPTARALYLGALGVLFLAALVGRIVLLVRQNSAPGIEILLPTSTPSLELKVYMSGEVVRPGVYTLREGDRLEEALAAAGGATEDADLSRVNLALRVKDQDQFHVLKVGEAEQGVFAPATTDQSGRLNINTASAQELEILPGIGPVRARAIIDYREKNGPFKIVQEVMEVRGIGDATFEAIRELIFVGQGTSP